MSQKIIEQKVIWSFFELVMVTYASKKKLLLRMTFITVYLNGIAIFSVGTAMGARR